MKDYLGYYLIAINVITFLVFFWDKQQSIKNAWRIRERTLLLLCFIGGSFGGFMAMRLLRHKNRKTKMRTLIIGFTLLWAMILIYLGSRWG